MLICVSAFHSTWGYIAAAISGAVGLWGVLMRRRQTPPRLFYYAVGLAIAGLLVQVTVGVIVAGSGVDPGNQHVFYGVVIAVTFAFTYIYRAQFRKRPAFYYGLLLLFTMGLGIRGIMTFGGNF
jgi:heme A synthase